VRATAADSGYAVALDPRTGDVLALASVPTFDANKPGAARPPTARTARSVDVFEPGSTSKVITRGRRMEERASRRAAVPVDDEIRRGGKVFHDSHTHAREKLTFAGVLAQSSNVGTIMAGERVPPKDMYDYLRRFGLGSPTGIGLAESRGILADVDDWNRSQRYTVLFGQGLSGHGAAGRRRLRDDRERRCPGGAAPGQGRGRRRGRHDADPRLGAHPGGQRVHRAAAAADAGERRRRRGDGRRPR
jgi:cell division protein FtsI (penicillin-binding protein 3)